MTNSTTPISGLLRKFSLIFALLLISLVACEEKDSVIVANPTEDANLIGYYPFDGNALDASIFEHHGTVDGVQFVNDRNGVANSAAFFDGGSHIEIPNNGFGNGYEFSLSFWINFSRQDDVRANDNSIIQKWASTAGSTEEGYPFIIRTGNQTHPQNPLDLCTTRAGGPGECLSHVGVCSDNSQLVGDGNWHHVAYIRRGSLVELWLDGILIDRALDDLACSPHSNAPIYIGTHHPSYNYSNWWNGQLDDLRLYNTAIDQETIEALAEK